MKITTSITLDIEAKQALINKAKNEGMTLSGYINMLGHASKIYHEEKTKEEKK